MKLAVYEVSGHYGTLARKNVCDRVEVVPNEHHRKQYNPINDLPLSFRPVICSDEILTDERRSDVTSDRIFKINVSMTRQIPARSHLQPNSILY